MKTRCRKCNSDFRQPGLTIWIMTVQFILVFNISTTLAQKTTSSDFSTSVPVTADTTRKLSGCKITDNGYGGPVIKLSRFNNQFTFMTGGRGACTINNRYTLGGGGYGIASLIGLSGPDPDTSRYFKMGYGGLELGYIFFSGKKVNIGGSLLIAAGASFCQNKLKSNSEKLFDDDFNFFPVMEPSLYSDISLNRVMKLHAGISYRYVHNTHLDYLTDQNIKGFSCYVGLLFGKTQ